MKTVARMLSLCVGLAAFALLVACGDGTGPATSRNNPGTGTSTLRVTADIDASDQPGGGFITDFDVSVRDGLGNPVSGATVTIANAASGTVTLTETGTGSGDYFAQRSSFPAGDFRLDVVWGSDNVRNVVLGGPGVHSITAPLASTTVPANQPLTVRWSVPSQAQAAEVETRDFGPVTVPDNGTYVIAAADNPPNASQRIRVFRFNEVTMAGGLPGSRLHVEVRKTVEPVNVQP